MSAPIDAKIEELIPFLVAELENEYDKASDNDTFTVYTVNYNEHDLFLDKFYDNCTSRVLAPSKQAAIDYLNRDNLVEIRSIGVTEEKLTKGDIEKVKSIMKISNAYHTYITPEKYGTIALKIKNVLKENIVNILS